MFTVRFINYAGDDLLGTVEADYGEDITSKALTPEVFPGKTFNGWNVPITRIVEDMTVRSTYVDMTYTVDGSCGSLIKTYSAVNDCGIVLVRSFI